MILCLNFKCFQIKYVCVCNDFQLFVVKVFVKIHDGQQFVFSLFDGFVVVLKCLFKSSGTRMVVDIYD